MLSISSATRFAVALLPSLVVAASTTITFTFGGVETTAVVQLPEPYTKIVTVGPPQIITTTIVLTAPASRITEIVGKIPQTVQDIRSEEIGDILPITVNGYVASIKLPASVSIPADTQLPPIIPVIIPAATISAQSVASVVSVVQETLASVASGKELQCPKTSIHNG